MQKIAGEIRYLNQLYSISEVGKKVESKSGHKTNFAITPINLKGGHG
jgi:hypothetical protein